MHAEHLEPSQVNKRSVVINHHKTSVSLEQPFWQYIRQMAERAEVTPYEFIATVDAIRKHNNLTSCLRLVALQDFQARIADLEAELAHTRGGTVSTIPSHVVHVS